MLSEIVLLGKNISTTQTIWRNNMKSVYYQLIGVKSEEAQALVDITTDELSSPGALIIISKGNVYTNCPYISKTHSESRPHVTSVKEIKGDISELTKSEIKGG